MKTRGIIVTVAAFLSSFSYAVAADSMAADYWSGPYIGVFGGYAHSTTDFGDVDDYWDNQEMNALTDNGFTGGLYGGFNMQSGSMVYGLDASIGMMSNKDISCVGNNDCANDYLETDIGAYGTIKGRVGLAVDNVLLYGAAGVAMADLSYTNSDGGTIGKDDAFGVGLALAGGLETMISDNMTLRFQAEYLNFGRQKFFDAVNDSPFTDTTSVLTATAGVSFNF